MSYFPNQLGQKKIRVALYRKDGKFLADLTKYMTAGTFTRQLNGMSEFNGEFTSDFSTKFENLNYWSTWIMCEEIDENIGLDRIIGQDIVRDQWYGPVLDFTEDNGNYTIFAGDITAYWKRAFVPSINFEQVDVATIMEALISEIFRDDLSAFPNLDVEIAGSLKSVEYDSAQEQLFSDIIPDLPRVNYCAIGKTLYIRGIDSQATASLKLNDDSWKGPLPSVRKAGTVYANRVVVKGTGVSASAEASEAEIRDKGLICRRFDRPEINTVAAAKQVAKEILSQTRDAAYINPSNTAKLSPDTPIELIDLIPGLLVDVDHSVTRQPIQRRFLLSQVQVNCKSGEISVGLEPLKTLEEG